MKIAIIGSGNVGTALGDGWSKTGHTVVYGTREGKKPDNKSAAQFASIVDAVAQSDAVVLAVPWEAVPQVLQAAGGCAGKLVLDCANPIGPGFTLALGTTTSGAETVAQLAPGARVVKAFNTTGYENMRNPRIGSVQLTMFYCGDDAAAKKLTAGLITDIGFAPVDAGPLQHARYLEPLAMLWIKLFLQRGRGIALNLLERD